MIQEINLAALSREERAGVVATIQQIMMTSPNIIDLVPIIVRNMPDVDPRYSEPAKVIAPAAFQRERNVA